MEEIKIGDRVILGNVAGEIVEINNAFFKLKFDIHKIDDEDSAWYPNSVIHHLQEIDLTVKQVEASKNKAKKLNA